MLLPTNGSVVVIDDLLEEALPIIQVLSKNGISSTFYRGNNSMELPSEPMQLIRLVFLDLQLFDTVTDEAQISRTLVNVLKKIISSNNGPYLLVIWSKNYAKYGAAVEEEIKKPEHKIAPAYIVTFNKRDCLVETTVEVLDTDDFIKEVLESLESGLEDGESDIIRRAIKAKLDSRIKTEFQPREDAIQIIERHIKTQLEKAGVFHLFVIWENLVKKSSSRVAHEISELVPINKNWESNMRDLFRRMGIARTGRNTVSEESLIKESINTFNNSFVDRLETEIKNVSLPASISLSGNILISDILNNESYSLVKEPDGESLYKETTRIIKGTNRDGLLKSLVKDPKIGGPDKLQGQALIERYDNIPSLLNAKLHIEFSPSQELIPGNIYIVENIGSAKVQKYLSTYFKTIDGSVSDYFLIDLEVSPVCDYAQDKWKRSRTLPGVLFPSLNYKNIKSGTHFYDAEPEFEFNSKPYRLRFDFHLFNALDKVNARARTVKYRLKRELLQDIIAQLSSHVNRPGITFIS